MNINNKKKKDPMRLEQYESMGHFGRTDKLESIVGLLSSERERGPSRTNRFTGMNRTFQHCIQRACNYFNLLCTDADCSATLKTVMLRLFVLHC